MENKNNQRFILKNPIELGKMTTEQLIEYIDKLHSVVRNYQVVINIAIHKNEDVIGL